MVSIAITDSDLRTCALPLERAPIAESALVNRQVQSGTRDAHIGHSSAAGSVRKGLAGGPVDAKAKRAVSWAAAISNLNCGFAADG